MLILQRKAGESIKISDDIYITVVRTRPGSLRIGITAPPDIAVSRIDRPLTDEERDIGKKPTAR